MREASRGEARRGQEFFGDTSSARAGTRWARGARAPAASGRGGGLSGVWLGVPRGQRLQFSARSLHLLGKGTTSAPFWGSPITPSLPTYDHERSCLQSSTQTLVSLWDPLQPLSPYTPARNATADLPSPTPKATRCSRALLPASLAASPGRTLFPTSGNGFSLASASAALRISHDLWKTRIYPSKPQPFADTSWSYSLRLLRLQLFPGSSVDPVLCRCPHLLPAPQAPRHPSRSPPQPAPLLSLCSALVLCRGGRAQGFVGWLFFCWRNFKMPVVGLLKKL